MRQMNCPICDTAGWFIFANIYVLKNINLNEKLQVVATFELHKCPKELKND